MTDYSTQSNAADGASFQAQAPVGINPTNVFVPPHQTGGMVGIPHDDRSIQSAPVASQLSTKISKAAAQSSSQNVVYAAVYSSVSVYEMMCRGVAVMRRQKDSYLNATQVLKVANIDKGKRTKILEKEIQNKEHEKVQGGYGKYQGTWYQKLLFI